MQSWRSPNQAAAVGAFKRHPRQARHAPFLMIVDVSVGGVVVKESIQLFDVVRKASIPQSVDSAIAISLSEAVAGGVGALLSRGVANVVGDIKVDSLRTKITSTSAFFGVRALLRTGLRLLGFPRPIALVLASLAGSLAFESTKASGRAVLNDSNSTFTESVNNLISLSEIAGDVVKWISFDVLSEAIPPVEGAEKNAYFFGLGAVSALAGNFVKENLAGEADAKDEKKPAFVSYSQAAIEGGVLFLTYGVMLYQVMSLVPMDLDREFFFNSILEEGEKDVRQLVK